MCMNQLVARLIVVLSLLLAGCADGVMRHDGRRGRRREADELNGAR